MHKEKLFSITFTKAPWPDFVMHFVMYSITASLDSVAWKSQFDSMAKMMIGTKLFRKLQLRASHNRYSCFRLGSSAISSSPGRKTFRGHNLLQNKRPCSSVAQDCSAAGGP